MAEGRPLELFWRRQYVPEQGMFRDAPADLALGQRLPQEGKADKGVRALPDGKGFAKDGVEYRCVCARVCLGQGGRMCACVCGAPTLPAGMAPATPPHPHPPTPPHPTPTPPSEGDFLFLGPEVFDQLDAARDTRERPDYLKNSKFNKARTGKGGRGGRASHALGPLLPAPTHQRADQRAPPCQGSYEGLRAWGIAQLVRLGSEEKKGKKKEADKRTRGGEAKVRGRRRRRRGWAGRCLPAPAPAPNRHGLHARQSVLPPLFGRCRSPP